VDIERLRRLRPFGELDHHDLSILARWVSPVDVPEGQLLVEQGNRPHELFVIEEGTAEVTRDGRPIASLGPGDVAGEMGLLKPQRRMASVRATTRVRAVALDAEGLASMTEQMPELAAQLRETMAQRERANEP
jgi:CRP/FNR family transcriptional regulator, cyclic AMP receptor protein